MFVLVLFCSLLASVAVVLATALLFRKPYAGRALPFVLSFAVGTLLSSAFLGLLPSALARGPAHSVLATTLVGILLFLALEKLLIWRHCHVANCTVHHAAGSLIVIGDAFHNLVDGVMIAAAFLVSVPMGITLTLAIIAHEVPQEIGDFAILLHGGRSYGRALLLNCVSALTTPAGAVIGFLTLSAFEAAVPYLLALSAASFIYIGTADLIPGLQKESRAHRSLAQFACVLLGVFVITGLRMGMSRT